MLPEYNHFEIVLALEAGVGEAGDERLEGEDRRGIGRGFAAGEGAIGFRRRDVDAGGDQKGDLLPCGAAVFGEILNFGINRRIPKAGYAVGPPSPLFCNCARYSKNVRWRQRAATRARNQREANAP